MIRMFLAFSAITALLLGTSGAQAERFPDVLAPPDAPWPEGGIFAAYLCREDDAFEVCGDMEVTSAQRRAIEVRLRQLSGISDFHYESKTEALANILKNAPELAKLLEESDMPESFQGKLIRWSDAAAYDSVARSLPGVSNAVVLPFPYWVDKADVGIDLCNAGRGLGACERRGQVTEDERVAIETLLRRMKGVERIYYEDPAHAAQKTRTYRARWSQAFDRGSSGKGGDANSTPPEEFPESYYVKLDDPKLAGVVVDALKGMPGVRMAYEMS